MRLRKQAARLGFQLLPIPAAGDNSQLLRSPSLDNVRMWMTRDMRSARPNWTRSDWRKRRHGCGEEGRGRGCAQRIVQPLPRLPPSYFFFWAGLRSGYRRFASATLMTRTDMFFSPVFEFATLRSPHPAVSRYHRGANVTLGLVNSKLVRIALDARPASQTGADLSMAKA